MSNSKSFLKNDKIQNTPLILKEQNEPVKNFNKIATLQPYLSDIQKRQRMKSKLSKTNKNNQSSSRSFRIKEVSTSSLHKLNFEKIQTKNNKLLKNKQTINTTVTILNNKKIKPTNQLLVRQRKAKSHQNRTFQSSFSKTINTRQLNNGNQINIKNQNNSGLNQQKERNEKTNFFNDYFLRMNQNKDKQLKFRKNMYENIHKNISNEEINHQISIKKISCTDSQIERNNNHPEFKKQEELKVGKQTQVIRKNNFRRGKYQIALYSSVNQKPATQDSQPLQSQRLYQLNKKQSNLSINQQMDILAEKQMQKFYRQIRNKQLQKSIQKSTQKYFCNDSYRRVKSKNQIQLYLSSMINPSLNKISQSTYDKSDNRNKSPLDKKNVTDLYAYNFDFEPQKNNLSTNNEKKFKNIQHQGQEQEINLVIKNQQNFEKQRRHAEIEYFNKGHLQLDWSDDNCQVDDI